MKRVIRRPAMRSGKRALLISLFPLLCAALLLLSGCGGRATDPNASRTTDKNSTVQGASTVSGAPGATTPDNAKTEETSAPVLTRADLGAGDNTALDNLAIQVSKVSNDLAALEAALTSEELTLPGVLSSAKTWLDDLKTATNELLSRFNARYAGKSTPGLEQMSQRLGQMATVIQKNIENAPREPEVFEPFQTKQEALARLRIWVNELADIAQALPDVPSTGDNPNPEPLPEPLPEPPSEDILVKLDEATQDLSSKMDALKSKVDAMEGKVDALSGTVTGISGKVNAMPTETPRVSLGWFGTLAFVISVLNFALLLYVIRLLHKALAPQQGSASRKNSAKNPTEKGKPSGESDFKDKVKNLPSDVAEVKKDVGDIKRLLSSIISRLEAPLNRDSASESPKKTAPDSPPPKPQAQYFKVVNSDAADGQPIYLQKKSIRSELRGTPAGNDQSAYRISPVMSDETDDGRHGKLTPNVLYTGDIKVCFDMPKERLSGWELSVTVEKRAVIRQAGNNQYELAERGKLSVSGGS